MQNQTYFKKDSYCTILSYLALSYLSLVVVLLHVFAHVIVYSKPTCLHTIWQPTQHTAQYTNSNEKLLTVQLPLEVSESFRQRTQTTTSCDVVPRVQARRTGEELEG